MLFSQEKGGILSGVFRKKVAKSQSQVRWSCFLMASFQLKTKKRKFSV